MKRILSLLLALLTAAALFGCGRAERPVLRVAMSPDFAPMEFLDDSKTGQDRFVGFDVELARYLADGLGMELQIVSMSFEACQDAVAEGDVDMAISGFSWLPQREERFNLSDPYHAGNNSASQVLLVRKADAARFTDARQLAGHWVGAQAASLQEWLISEQLPEARALAFDDLDAGVELLRSGMVDALAVAEGNASAILSSEEGFALAKFRFTLRAELQDNLILMKKGDDQLTAAVNDLLRKAEEAGYYPQWYAQALALAGMEAQGQDSEP